MSVVKILYYNYNVGTVLQLAAWDAASHIRVLD